MLHGRLLAEDVLEALLKLLCGHKHAAVEGAGAHAQEDAVDTCELLALVWLSLNCKVVFK